MNISYTGVDLTDYVDFSRSEISAIMVCDLPEGLKTGNLVTIVGANGNGLVFLKSENSNRQTVAFLDQVAIITESHYVLSVYIENRDIFETTVIQRFTANYELTVEKFIELIIKSR